LAIIPAQTEKTGISAGFGFIDLPPVVVSSNTSVTPILRQHALLFTPTFARLTNVS